MIISLITILICEIRMFFKLKNIYQFKIILDGLEPKIWRRIQVVGNYDFYDFHIAIQEAMGWEDCHTHAFEVINPICPATTIIPY